MNSVTPLARLLTRSNSQIARLVTRTAILRRLQNAVNQALGDGIGAKCRVVNLREGTLVLCVPSPAWSARLRTAIPELQRRITSRSDLPPIRTIRLQVCPPEVPKISSHLSQRAKLSTRAASAIQAAANSVRDTALRAALLRLAERAKKPDPDLGD